METKIFKISSADDEGIIEAASLLKEGKLVILWVCCLNAIKHIVSKCRVVFVELFGYVFLLC